MHIMMATFDFKGSDLVVGSAVAARDHAQALSRCFIQEFRL